MTKLKKKPEEKKGMDVAEVKKQAEITAKDIVRQIEEAIDHGRLTYFELNRILREYLEKVIDETLAFCPEGFSYSLREIGCKKLYRVLVEMRKKEEAAKN